MKRLYILLSISIASYALNAQTIKTSVLIVGNNTMAISAAIQAARSGVKTLIIDSDFIGSALTQGELLSLKNNIQKIENVIKKTDPLTNLKPGSITLRSIVDTLKNLTVMNNTSCKSIEKKGKDWEVETSAGKIKTQFIVDGTKDALLSSKAGLTRGKAGLKYQPITPFSEGNNDILSSKQFRTIAATANNQSIILQMAALLPFGVENFISLTNYPSGINPDPISYGQAVGAISAFCTFFKKTSKFLDIRVTQGELLGYGSTLIPFRDIEPSDSTFISLQHIALTGILKADSNLNFKPESTISIVELKPVMKEYYSRSQLWFLNNTQKELTIQDAINLLTFTATRGEELKKEIEKNWQTNLKLVSTFDPNRLITRREFAVLLDTYLKPFTVRVDFYGNLLN